VAYKKRRYALSQVLPAEVLRELMIAHNLRQAELADIFGSYAAVTYALHGKRNLTPGQIRGLFKQSHVFPAVFF
jgi:antitoxin component HigA of HigAB toxin-antitoxin module